MALKVLGSFDNIFMLPPDMGELETLGKYTMYHESLQANLFVGA